jgi:Mor family transcriptional regulator
VSESLRNDVAEILMGLLGVDAETAHWIANGVTDGLRERYPGGRINAYLAEMTREERRQRAMAIRAEFNGRNLAELARKYGLSKSRVRQIACARSSRNRTCTF